ncbi:glycosyltransferase [Synechococcus sp. HK05]|uniref:glycosyltransferase n=1 Tax=Synechococcus sp. HK05 TaxID=2725975 RepID=UPI001C37F87B|nr:glycosyltransferase [Synechococcus sp. HK05]MBV2352138.1 glycosyltransferase [Synechococcus sp. HK05]
MTSAPLLLIVGMHRSGTSLLGSLLSACGIAMPGPLLVGDAHNPEGYFERADVTALQEQLLIDFDRWWPSPRGMRPLPDAWLDSPRGRQALRQLTGLLEAECHNTPWVIKDPRSSVLLPLWRAACEQLAMPLQVVLAVRDPREVIVSLVQRDHQATGMDGWRGQRLWWHHNRSVVLDSAGLPLQVVHYSHWFDPKRGFQQLHALVPHCEETELRSILSSVVKSEHRRSHRQARSTPVSAQVRRLERRLRALAMHPHQRDGVQQWLMRQPDPPALAPHSRRRGQIKRAVNRWLGQPIPNRAATHPWGDLAEMVCGSQGPAADHQLLLWIQYGFSEADWRRIAALPGSQPLAEAWQATAATVVIHVRGGNLHHWAAHAWAQHCPIEGGCFLELEPFGAALHGSLALNFADVHPGACGARELLQLAALERVWDPDPARVQLLRQFGVRASCLQLEQATNGYLQPHEGTWADCATQLGLAAPAQLASLGSTLCLGSAGPALDCQLQSPLLGVPGFAGLRVESPDQGRLLAVWLQGCLDAGLELVRFCSSAEVHERNDWRAFVQSNRPGCAPILCFSFPVGDAELRAELEWYRQGCPSPASPVTPTPDVRAVLQHDTSVPCQWAVCISLHNYGSRICNALESVLAQQACASIELIVVDDASTDDGVDVALDWMQRHQHSFARCLLLQHLDHGGLAAARNTSFSAATSSWCFVLDADNTLEPLALAHCGALATNAHEQCGVVHSLIRVVAEQGSDDQRSLVSYLPWQKELFRRGNYIDAMALVRRDAWRAVGGYVHSVEGWEDFDFWCLLVEAGWHGVLCPEVLATYTSHIRSMTQRITVKGLYRASRFLQSRHPWLNLPRAHDQAIWPTSMQR